jgi:hypothetical protein
MKIYLKKQCDAREAANSKTWGLDYMHTTKARLRRAFVV